MPAAPAAAVDLTAIRHLVEAQAAARAAITASTVFVVRQMLAHFDGWYSSRDVAGVTKSIVDHVEAGQRLTARTTDAYSSRLATEMTGRPILPVGGTIDPATLRAGVTHAGAYGRLANQYRYDVSQGKAPDEAQARVLTRAGVMVDTDQALAMRSQSQRFMQARGITRYRRVIHPEVSKTGVCGLCIVASDRLYWVGNLLPIHDRCNCEVAFVTGVDPGAQLNRKDLDELYAAAGGSTAAADLHKVHITVHDHGELGPILARATDNWRGPADVRAVEPAQRVAERGWKQDVAAAKARLPAIDRFTKIGRGLPDLTATGELGDRPAQAVEAVLDAGRALDREITRRLGVPVETAERRAYQEAMTRFQAAAWASTVRQGAIRDRENAAAEARLGRHMRTWTDLEWAAHDAVIRALSDQDPVALELKAQDESAFAKLRAARARMEAAERPVEKRRETVTREVLAELRPIGGRELNYSLLRGRRQPAPALVAAMRRAETEYPQDWLDLAAERFPAISLVKTRRGINKSGADIGLSRSPSDPKSERVALHELGHTMELVVPGLRALEWAFHYRRGSVAWAGGKRGLPSPKDLFGGDIGMGVEVAVEDAWANAYSGKVYGAGRPAAQWEVFTTGIEALLRGGSYFTRSEQQGGDDAEFRAFVLGVLGVL